MSRHDVTACVADDFSRLSTAYATAPTGELLVPNDRRNKHSHAIIEL